MARQVAWLPCSCIPPRRHPLRRPGCAAGEASCKHVSTARATAQAQDPSARTRHSEAHQAGARFWAHAPAGMCMSNMHAAGESRTQNTHVKPEGKLSGKSGWARGSARLLVAQGASQSLARANYARQRSNPSPNSGANYASHFKMLLTCSHARAGPPCLAHAKLRLPPTFSPPLESFK